MSAIRAWLADVLRRIAVPMIGGMVSSTVLTLLVIPAIYAIVKGWRLPRENVPSTASLESATSLVE